MKYVYKYALKTAHVQRVAMPRGARIVHVAVQREALCLWALIDTGDEQVERTFYLFGTGHPIDINPSAPLRHCGAFFVQDGDFVYHLFEHVNAPSELPHGSPNEI